MIRSKVDMMEATRLTRQGRLVEALAILRGTATSAPGSETGYNSESKTQPTANERQRTIIDMVSPRDSGRSWTAPWGGGRDAPSDAPAVSTHMKYSPSIPLVASRG